VKNYPKIHGQAKGWGGHTIATPPPTHRLNTPLVRRNWQGDFDRDPNILTALILVVVFVSQKPFKAI